MGLRWTEQALKVAEPLWEAVLEQNIHYIDMVVRCRTIAAAKANF